MIRTRAIILFLLCAVLAAGCASRAERVAEREKSERLVSIKTQLGVEYFQRGQYEIALNELESALKVLPGDSQANNIMGLLRKELKQYDKADHFFRQAVKDINNAEAQNNYGVFLCEQGRLDEAIGYFEQAAANPLYKTPDIANLNAGLCLMKKPAPPEAAKFFRAALELNPKLAPALYQMAKISYDRGNTVSARGFLQRYFEVAEDTPESLLLAFRVEHALRNKDAEASYALRLRGKFPDSPEAMQLKKQPSGPR